MWRAALLGGYRIEYNTTADCSTWSSYELRTYCEAKYSDVTVIKGDFQVGGSRLYPSQSYLYEEETYRIDVTFHLGQASPYPKCTDQPPPLGPQLISNFTIHITETPTPLKPEIHITVTPPEIHITVAPPEEAPLLTYGLITVGIGIAIAGIAIAIAIVKRKKG